MVRSIPSVYGRSGRVLVLPPFHCGPGSFAAAATRLPRALGASREELGHELGHVWELWVGIQHVHGLFHFLEMKGKGLMHTPS